MEKENTPKEEVKTMETQNNTDITLPEIAQKEEEIKKRKRKFKLFVLSFGGIILFVIILTIIVGIINAINLKNKQKYEKVEEPIQTPVENPQESWNSYDNTEVRVKFKYPNTSKIIENREINQKIRNVEVIYTPNGIDNVSESNLVEGFIFRITPLQLDKRALEDVVSVKRESFHTECGDNAEISSIRASVVDNLEAKTFDVRNCNGDFNVTYFSRFGIFFEINQVYRGDIGYRQQYMNTTEEIMKTVTLYPEEIVEEGPYKDFVDEGHKITFKYPKELNTTCCKVDDIDQTAEKIITLGTKETEDKYGAIAIYVEGKNQGANRDKTFDQIVQMKKDKFISDYKIVNAGREPTIIEEQFQIGGMFAVRFKGLSWKGNDIIFVDVTTDDRNFFGITTTNKIGTEFEKIIEGILDSMQFVVKK